MTEARTIDRVAVQAGICRSCNDARTVCIYCGHCSGCGCPTYCRIDRSET